MLEYDGKIRLIIDYNVSGGTRFSKLAQRMLIGAAGVSASKEKKDAQAGDPTDRKPARPKDKMIRLDDLIPKQTVSGGRKLFFGAADPQQPTQKQKDK